MKKPRIPTWFSVASTSFTLVFLAVSPALAQDDELTEALREALREQADRSHLGNAFQSLSVLGGTPGVSSAHFNVDSDSDTSDDLKISTTKLPLSHDFEPIFSTGVRPYAEITLGYLTADESDRFELAPEEGTTRIDVDYTTWTALGGVGVAIPVAEGTTLRPIVLVGYSRITDDADLSGPFSEELEEAGSGIIFDVEIDSLTLGGALELEHKRTVADDVNFVGTVRYNHVYVDNYDASDKVLETSDDFGVFTARGEFDGPTGTEMFGRELRWIGFAGTSYLVGDQNDALGFSYFFEVGGGIEIVDRDVISGVEGVSLRGGGLIGDDVTGWSVGLELEF